MAVEGESSELKGHEASAQEEERSGPNWKWSSPRQPALCAAGDAAWDRSAPVRRCGARVVVGARLLGARDESDEREPSNDAALISAVTD